MTYVEWCKSKGIIRYNDFCNCGGFAACMNGRNPEHPHLDWCAQYEEYEDYYSQYEKGNK